MQSTNTSETIAVGALAVRFLVEAAESNGSVAVFECDVPTEARTPAPHSHDAFEETIYGLTGVTTWTVDGEAIEVGPARPCAFRAGRSTASPTAEAPTRRSWPSPARASSVPRTSARSARSSPPGARPTTGRSRT